jgi:hypothetical protein
MLPHNKLLLLPQLLKPVENSFLQKGAKISIANFLYHPGTDEAAKTISRKDGKAESNYY